MSSWWFDCIEPSLTTYLEGKQFVQDAYALVRGSQVHRTSSSTGVEGSVKHTKNFEAATDIVLPRKFQCASGWG